jgi:Cd2+/Zn2+-exporting ATPase
MSSPIHKSQRSNELRFAILSGIAFALGVVTEYDLGLPMLPLPAICYGVAYFFGGFYTFGGAIRSVSRGRFEVDFLMLIAALGAAAVGRFGEGAVLLFLFSLGHALEEYALSRAERSITALAALAPRTALLKTGGTVVERPVETLVVGDIVLVRANSRVPADGVVVGGSSSVDQSSVTGESIPVDKVPVDKVPVQDLASIRLQSTVPRESRVFAGTITTGGSLDVMVSALAEDSTLARVMALVKEADATKSPTQKFLDTFQRHYVRAVLAVVVVVFIGGLYFVDSMDVQTSFFRAMVVLVAASPCALAIATPAAVLSGVARAARAGILVKGGGPLEALGRVSSIAFDKTGTLTWGRPQVTDVHSFGAIEPRKLAAITVAVETHSDHPIAAAIVRDLTPLLAETPLPTAQATESITGRGMTATVDGAQILVGSAQLMAENRVRLSLAARTELGRLQDHGRTTLLVAQGATIIGAIGVMDTARSESRAVLNVLREGGIGQLVMISGDNQSVADATARSVELDVAYGDLLPEDKVDVVAQLASAGSVAMVGDGVNDAPALAASDVGIAMGAAGSPVALETADIALMSDDLGRLPFAVSLSRATRRIIRQNLVISLAIVALLVPASLLGMAIGPVVFLHEGSTLIVVFNALRLLRFRNGLEHAGVEHEVRPTAAATRPLITMSPL